MMLQMMYAEHAVICPNSSKRQAERAERSIEVMKRYRVLSVNNELNDKLFTNDVRTIGYVLACNSEDALEQAKRDYCVCPIDHHIEVKEDETYIDD